MKICLLSKTELARWTNYQIKPSCNKRMHRHITRRAAMQGIRDDVYREVDGLAAVVEQDSNNRHWRGRPSGHKLGIKVLQLVNP